MLEIRHQLELLSSYSVDYVIVGGVAAALHGSSIPTYDLDVCYSRESDNLDRLAQALISVHARLRGAPPGLPFVPEAETLRKGLNFTFETDIGSLDLLGEVLGVGGFEESRQDAVIYELFGKPHHVLAIDKLIAAKKAAGRIKDLNMIPELEAIREVTTRSSPDSDS
jgi:hypothetical protein